MANPVGIREKIARISSDRILILDGAMGALIQMHRTASGEALEEGDFRGELFKDHPLALKGCNDLLCLTMPDLILNIHKAYLESGADIIETCSFNANAISLADYGLESYAYRINVAAARLAREAADSFSTGEKPRFVAGSLGPTTKSASISPDLDDPGKKAVTWDELEAAYYDNARGLLDGGADIILIETIFDTLNAKAAIFAVKRLEEERGIDIPIILSATVSEGGRLLAGQTVEAFCVSVLHANPLALGLNCSFGAEKLRAHVGTISASVPCLVIAYPNAGLPNRLGEYEESPDSMAHHVESYFNEGLVNIVGGCCGSTPAHIAAIAKMAAKHEPRPLPLLSEKTLLSGLEHVEVNREKGLSEIGERTNVAGSRKFLRLIKEKKYDEAVSIAIGMVEAGAVVVDVCMDDALLDAKEAMTDFLGFALQFPELSRIPVMIDSSRWEVIEAGLKCLQGKGLVNSISLKEGEAEFLRRAALARKYGAAVVVMLFDEEGQAASLERRMAVAARSYKLLVNAKFPPEDIVFDPNVLAIATGIPEHDDYALTFFKACQWIRDNCPHSQISGGISNLSFSFRGNNVIREAMHAVFIKHAMDHGLSMAIVNPSTLISYEDIEKDLRQLVEDLILDRKAEEGASNTPVEKLLALAESLSEQSAAEKGAKAKEEKPKESLSADERVSNAVVKGMEDTLEKDIEELRGKYKRPLEIIEGPLMAGIREVGDKFSQGRMFLPQVLRAARVMKKAVELLEPYLEKEDSSAESAKILVATVKGDVHDIGKNIAALVLGCNGYKIVDLGVMVPAETIVERAREEKADIIGLSGLITPSLDEMIHVAREMEKQGFTIPLIIGGAAASLAHTALRIVPVYSGPVVYIPDASQGPPMVRSLLSETERSGFLEKLNKSYTEALDRHNSIQKNRDILSLEDARNNKPKLSWSVFDGTEALQRYTLPEIFSFGVEQTENIITLNDYPISRVAPYIDWTSFVQTWDLAENTYPIAYDEESKSERKKILAQLLDDAKALLEKISKDNTLSLRGVVGLFPAYSEGDDIVLANNKLRFSFPRSQEKKAKDIPNPCLADFILPKELYDKELMELREKQHKDVSNMAPNPAGQLGLFCLSAGFGLLEMEKEYRSRNDDYSALLFAGLANSLAEAFSEEIHRRISISWGGSGIRPAFGYPACPDHRDKEIVFDLLEAGKNCTLRLTETAMIIPAASVCGIYIAHPDSYYFGIGAIGDDQLYDLGKRKGITIEEVKKRLGRVATG